MLEPLGLHVLVACRVAVGASFALAAAGKLRDMAGFVHSIGELVAVGERARRPLAAAVAVAEVAVVATLAIGGSVLLWGFGLAVALLLLFTTVLVAALARGRRVACNCFGRNLQPITPHDVTRNIALLACGVAGLALAASSAAGQGPGAAADTAIAAMMGLVITALLLHVPELAMLGRPARPIARQGGAP